MKREPGWISRQLALAIHGKLLAEHGGAAGLRDEGLLDSALAAPRNQLAYGESDLVRLAAAYAWAIARNHPFADGNKRVALTLAGVFLERNGFRFDATEQDAVGAMRALASGEMGEAQLTEWLRHSSAPAAGRRSRRPAVKGMNSKRRRRR